MHIITFFAPKGGSGRTTTLMTAAAGFIEAGHHVGVIDMTEQARASARIARSDIMQWEDSMVESGITAEDLTTRPAWDRASYQSAIMAFTEAGCTRVLIDTPKTPSDLITDILRQSDVTVMPFVSYLEAAIISEWAFATKFPRNKVFGLPTGLTGTPEEKVVHRKALVGVPLMKCFLDHNSIYSGQLVNGSLFKMPPRKRDSVEEKALHRAQRTAHALAEELDKLLRWPTPRSYTAQEPVATGSRFAHVNALCDANPTVFQH